MAPNIPRFGRHCYWLWFFFLFVYSLPLAVLWERKSKDCVHAWRLLAREDLSFCTVWLTYRPLLTLGSHSQEGIGICSSLCSQGRCLDLDSELWQPQGNREWGLTRHWDWVALPSATWEDPFGRNKWRLSQWRYLGKRTPMEIWTQLAR